MLSPDTEITKIAEDRIAPNVLRQIEMAESIIKENIEEQTRTGLVNLALRGHYLATLVLELQTLLQHGRASTVVVTKLDECRHVYTQSYHCMHCGKRSPSDLRPNTIILYDPYATFVVDNIGQHVFLEHYTWRARIYDWFNTRVRDKETKLTGRYIVSRVFDETHLEVRSTIFCRVCRKIQPTPDGHPDDHAVCEKCWSNQLTNYGIK